MSGELDQRAPERAEGEQHSRGGVVPARTVRMSGETAPVGAPRHGPACEPQVEVIREGGVVRAIDVTCTCGRKIRLHCVY